MMNPRAKIKCQKIKNNINGNDTPGQRKYQRDDTPGQKRYQKY